MITNLLNIEILTTLLSSFIYICINHLVTFLLIYFDDTHLFFINNKIKYINNDLYLDSDSDSSIDFQSEKSESPSDSSIDSDFDSYINKNIVSEIIETTEYEKIINLFNIFNNEENINQLYKKTYINNILLEENDIYIITSFLFNFNNESDIVDLSSIYVFTKKLILLYLYYKNLNINYIKNLNLNYKYLYILYKIDNEYKYLIIDLENNINIISNKKLLFNNINL